MVVPADNHQAGLGSGRDTKQCPQPPTPRRGLRIDEALFVPYGGYRSTLGTLKHIAGWSHVYRSYAFQRQPKHWAQIDWPRGLRETVESSQSYLDEVIGWAEAAHHN